MRVYQIYFKPEHLAKLEPEYIPYNNFDCDEYFESSVMRSLILRGAHKGTDYFGVVSYKLREKIGPIMKESWKNNPNIVNTSHQQFTPAEFERQLMEAKPDAMSFQRHSGHDPVRFAEGYHPGFRKYWEHIMSRIGYKWEPVWIQDIFYCNYFVARSAIYEKFVNEMLMPAMQVMDTMPELWNNSRYPEALPAILQERFEVKHYPFHAFICERMFTYFAHIHQLKCAHF